MNYFATAHYFRLSDDERYAPDQYNYGFRRREGFGVVIDYSAVLRFEIVR
jgi:hypothetical protein